MREPNDAQETSTRKRHRGIDKADTEHGKVVVDYMPDINYEPEGADPNDEPDAQEKKEKGNFNVEYAKMKLPCFGTPRQWTKCKIRSSVYI